MKKQLFTFFVLTFLATFNFLYAEKISKHSAKRLAKNFYAEKSGIPVSNIYFGTDFSYENNEDILFYIFNINSGFIIISGDNAVFPVLAYSFEDNWKQGKLPPGVKEWIDNYAKQIEEAANNNYPVPNGIKKVWEHYLNDKFIPSKNISGVEPLLTTTWGQDCYYNTAFPEEPAAPCEHLYTGCVTTAMAQIMKYFGYPTHGNGSYGYETGNYGYVEADFGNTAYNWNEMEDHLEDENEAVATLMFHCAVSLHSQFYPEGTGAYDTTVPGALINFFNYNETAQFFFRDDYPGDWKALLRSELDDKRPVLYGGVAQGKTYYGHTLVCDGYQDSAFFHFNWGANGSFNGYYYLDTLTAGGFNFNMYQDAVIGIKSPEFGINKLLSDEKVVIYPNPSYGEFYIDLKNSFSGITNILIYNIDGQKVFEKNNVNKQVVKIELKEKKGLFILTIEDSLKFFAAKVILR